MNDGNDVANITIDVASVGSKTEKKKRTNNENVAKTTTTVDIRNFFNEKTQLATERKLQKINYPKTFLWTKML